MREWPDAKMIRYFSFANSEALLVTGLDSLREILSVQTYSFVKLPVFEKLVWPIVGKGLLFAEGEEHKTQRKLVAGALRLTPIAYYQFFSLMTVPGAFALSKLKRLLLTFRQKAQELSIYLRGRFWTRMGL